MQILPLSFKNNTVQNNNVSNSNAIVKPRYAHALDRDTVCFTAKFSDFVTKSVSQNQERLQRIATTYLDTLEVVASRLKEHGFSFDRAYCELSPVKSPESYTSKIIRSKTFKVPDSIRATLYCNDAYNLDNLNCLFAEMKKRGYVLVDTEMSVKDLMKRGYIPTEKEALNPENAIKLVPDLDIRLDNVVDQISKLPPELKYSVGKPQKSGYEDIQMRFVRDFDKKPNPTQHELLILFGPEYAKAKHMESEKVYSLLRQFNELHLKPSDSVAGSNEAKANRYMDLIQQMFRGKVSEKLFMNAKNKDLYDLPDTVNISFSDMDKVMLQNYFVALKKRFQQCYHELKGNSKAGSAEYNQIATNQRQDTVLLNKIQKSLEKVIEEFGQSSKNKVSDNL